MKILNEKEVEEAAKDYVERNFETDVLESLDMYVAKVDFKRGALFAESKLFPMMIEFADWVLYNFNESKAVDEQLLEQFIKHKQEEITEKVK